MTTTKPLLAAAVFAVSLLPAASALAATVPGDPITRGPCVGDDMSTKDGRARAAQPADGNALSPPIVAGADCEESHSMPDHPSMEGYDDAADGKTPKADPPTSDGTPQP